MRKHYLLSLIILLIGSSHAYSQYQSILGTAQSSWRMNTWAVTPEFMTCLPESMWAVYNQDTTFQNMLFKPLKRQITPQNNAMIDGYISEDTTSGKVWFRDNHSNDTIIHLLMDMSLTATDSFLFDYGSVGSYKVAVDSIYYLNSRKIIELEEGEWIITNKGTKHVKYTMIEGVGVNILGINRNQGNSILQHHWKNNVLSYSAPVDSFFICDSLTSLKKETWVEENFEVYPNPIHTKANLILKEIKIEKIELIDINGQIIKTFSPTKNELNFAEVGSGVYFIIITTDNNTKARKKIVVQK